MTDGSSPPPSEGPPAPSPKPGRAPRWRRWGANLATAAALLGLFVAFLLITPWGLTLALRVLLAILHATALAGEIRFGDVDGGLLTRFRIEDVQLDDGRGRPAARVDAVEVELAVRPLLDGEIRVQDLVLRSPTVWVDTSTPGTNWSLFARSGEDAAPADQAEDEPGTVGPPFPLFASVTLHGGRLILLGADAEPTPQDVDDIELRATAEYADPRWQFVVDELSATVAAAVDQPDADEAPDSDPTAQSAKGAQRGVFPVRAAIVASLDPEALVVDELDVRADDASVSGSGRVGLGGPISAGLDARVPPGWPQLPDGLLPRGATARIDARLAPDGRLTGRVGIEAETSTATVRLDVALNQQQGEAMLDVAALDLREVVASAPALRFRGQAQTRAGWQAGFDLAQVQASTRVRLSGELPDGQTFEGLDVDARLRAGRAQVQSSLSMPQANLRLRARGRVAPALQPELLVLTATVPDVGAWTPEGADVKGKVQLSVRGQGARGRWSARLEALARDLRAGPWSSGTTRLTATATGTTDRLGAARARVLTTDNEVGRQRFGRVRLEAHRDQWRVVRFAVDAEDGGPVASVELSGTVTATSGLGLSIREGRLGLAEADWRLAPFTARLGRDQIFWRDLSARSDLGFLESRGRIDPRSGTGQAELRAQLDALNALPFVDLPSGSAGASADLAWTRDEISGRVDLSVADLELEPLANPLALELDAEARDDIQIVARASVLDGGEVSVRVAGSQPPAWMDPRAWAEWDLLQALTVSFDQVRLDRWLRSPTPDSANGPEGRLNGTLAYDRSGPSFAVDFDAADVSAPGVDVPLEMSMKGGVTDDGAQLEVDSRVADAPGPRVSGRAAVERRELPELDRVDLASRPFRVEGTLPELPMSLVTRLAGAPSDWTETATGAVGLTFSFENQPAWKLGLVAQARGKVRSGAPSLDAELDVALTERRAVATATVAGEGLGRASASYRVDLNGADQIFERWDQGRFEAEAQQIRLSGVRALVVLPAPLRGDVDARVAWDLAQRRGRLEVAVPDLSAGRTFGPFVVGASGTWTSTQTGLRVRLAPEGAKPLELDVRADAGLRALLSRPESTPLRGGWRLDPLDAGRLVRDPWDRQRFGGTITSTGTLAGVPTNLRVDGRLDWTDATIGRQSFDELGARVDRDDARTRASLSIVQRGGGRAEFRADVDDTDDRVAVDITAADFSIGFVSELAAMATNATTLIEGELSADLHISGAMSDPSLDGELTLDDLEVLVPGTLPRLDRGRLAVTTAGRQLDVELSARSGREGRIQLDTQVDLSDLRSPALNGKLTGENVEYLAGILPLQATFEIDLEGRKPNEHFELDVVIAKSRVIVTEQNLNESYAPIRSTPDVVPVETFGVRPIAQTTAIPPRSADPLQLVIQLRNGEPIRFRGTDSQAVATIDLRVDVRQVTTRVAGNADVSDGTVTLFGREYRIDKAIVRFTEAYPTDPQLDVQLSHSFERLSLTVIVTGRASDPKVRFTSDPGTYEQSQLLAFFAGLQNPDQEGPSGTPTEQAAGAAAGLLLGPVTKAVRQNLPIDTFDVSMGNGAPVVTVGKWLSDTLFVAYTWTVESQANNDEQQGLIRWRFYPGWALEVIAGLNLQSADLFWVRRF